MKEGLPALCDPQVWGVLPSREIIPVLLSRSTARIGARWLHNFAMTNPGPWALLELRLEAIFASTHCPWEGSRIRLALTAPLSGEFPQHAPHS
jgi:hypothetical protein